MFHWYKDNTDRDMTDAELASYIRGMVSMLDPTIDLDENYVEGDTTLMFTYPDEKE